MEVGIRIASDPQGDFFPGVNLLVTRSTFVNWMKGSIPYSNAVRNAL